MMSVERRVVLGTGLFIVPWAILYWFVSYERAGSLLLAACAVALLGLAAYLLVAFRHRPPRPEDRPDGVPAAEPTELGRFPSRSAWPLVAGAGAVLIGFGLAFTAWVALPGVLILAVSLVGLTAET
jgi:hypothetical protein